MNGKMSSMVRLVEVSRLLMIFSVERAAKLHMRGGRSSRMNEKVSSVVRAAGLPERRWRSSQLNVWELLLLLLDRGSLLDRWELLLLFIVHFVVPAT